MLIFQDVARAAREASENQHQVVFEPVQQFHVELQRPGYDAVVGVEVEAGHAAVRGDIGILFPDRLAKLVHLDITRQLRELRGMQHVAAVRVERLQQRWREAPRRSETSARRDVGERCDLDLRAFELQQTERFTNDRMPDLLDTIDSLELRVFEIDALPEGTRHGNKNVLFDRGGSQES